MNSKQQYISPKGHKVTIIRETKDTITLLVYPKQLFDSDNLSDPHEWTTTRQNFEKNYIPIDLVS